SSFWTRSGIQLLVPLLLLITPRSLPPFRISPRILRPRPGRNVPRGDDRVDLALDAAADLRMFDAERRPPAHLRRLADPEHAMFVHVQEMDRLRHVHARQRRLAGQLQRRKEVEPA